jgi:hypothetical protein
MTCYRHGRPARPRNPREEDALLDRFMPVYEAAERHHSGLLLPQGFRWRENQSLSKKKGGLDASHSGISRRGVEKCFFLTSSLIGSTVYTKWMDGTERDYNGLYDHAQD